MTKKVVIIMIVALIALVSCVNAEVLSGQIGEPDILSANYYALESGSSSYPGQQGEIEIYNIEYLGGLTTLVHFDSVEHVIYSGAAPCVWNGESSNVSIKFVATVYGGVNHGRELGDGSFGFQRSYTGWPPTETVGYQYWAFNNWNVSGMTGNERVTLSYLNSTNCYVQNNYNGNSTDIANTAPAGYMAFLSSNRATYMSGYYTQNRDVVFLNEYTAEKPLGLGIMGTVSKEVGGVMYDSQAYILNGTPPYTLIASQSGISDDDFIFNTVAQSIIIGAKSPSNETFNSPVLFSLGGGTPTPTPTPTATPTPAPTIAPGYVRTTVRAWDKDGTTVVGTTINIQDIEAGVWSNSTQDVDGVHYIDTLPYHTLNIYGSYDVYPNVYMDAELLGYETGYYGNYYYLTMYPYAAPPGAGNTNLYVTVLENINKYPVSNAFVQISIPNNATLGAYTNNAGVQVFTVPNNTVIGVSATKSGWYGNTIHINSGPGPTSGVTIGIDRQYATPTPTPTNTAGPGVTTPRPTIRPGCEVDPNALGCTSAKDADMMNLIRDAGPNLINLAIAATILGLLGLMMKGLK